MKDLHLVKNPLALHKLSLLRKKETPPSEFQRIMTEVSYFLCVKATENLLLEEKEIETPLVKTKAPFLKELSPVLIPILRAGNGFLEAFRTLLPNSPVGFIGLYREEKAKNILEYYKKLPEKMEKRRVFLLDPMLATGKSAVAAVDLLKKEKPLEIIFVNLLASREGLSYFHEKHPDVPVITLSVDPELDEKAYIVPGLGDAGDRIFATNP